MEAECEIKRRKLERRVSRTAQQGQATSSSSSGTMALHSEGAFARMPLQQQCAASSSARVGCGAIGGTEGTSSSSRGTSSKAQKAGVAHGPTGKSVGTYSDSLVLSKTKTLTWRACSLGTPCPSAEVRDLRGSGSDTSLQV